MPETSMSLLPALANLDILREILQHLSVYPHHDEDLRFVEDSPMRAELKWKRNALASAARTCKAFSELANDVLWAVLPGLVPILSTFSGFRIEAYTKSQPTSRFPNGVTAKRCVSARRHLSKD